MLKVYSSEDRFMVLQVKEMLESKGIACFVKNEFAIGAVGELSPFDSWPEVWISDDEWLAKAQEFIQTLTATPTDRPQWHCTYCHEENEGHFEICWQCHNNKP